MAFPATIVLVFFLIFRPQEIWQWLNAYHLLDVLTGLAALGVGLEFAQGKQRRAYTPQLPFLAAFVGIVFLTSIRFGARAALDKGIAAVTLAIFMLAVTYGARTLPRVRILVVMLVSLALFISAVAVDQGLTPLQCLEAPTEDEALALSIGKPDGRPCEYAVDCRKEGETVFADYTCERVGALNTVSTGGRVRWRGQLNDPNELAVFLGAVFPLIIALATWKKSVFVRLLVGVSVALGLTAVILTQSRGGQLVVATVFGVYFVSRFGVRGLFAAAIVAAPVLFLGGRSSEEAEGSAYGRTEVLYHGVTMFAQHPIFGIGMDQFAEHEGYTAHNAYLLAATELGLPGFFCWAGLVWTSVKIPLTLVRHPPPKLDPALRALAHALLVSFAGMAIGIFFLSFTFKQLLFVWLGMPGALYGIVRAAHPAFEVRVGWKDIAGILLFELLILSALYAYTRITL